MNYYDKKLEMFCHWQPRESLDGDTMEAKEDVMRICVGVEVACLFPAT